MDFIALDFETATSAKTSACEIGLTFVRNMEIVETKSWLIRPPDNYFDWYNIKVHGITPQMVENAPEFHELWKQELRHHLKNTLIIAHNASFDMGVLRGLLDSYSIAYPTLEYACSVAFSRRVWPGLKSYNLKALATHHGIAFKHHRAGADSYAAAGIAIKAFQKEGIGSVADFSRKLNMQIRQL